ncbi:MAG: hypothetical protein JO211_15465 [Acidobacteriaceae bacterium]|nr:hypothetical protein [Acidobacteriaceae bacterium]
MEEAITLNGRANPPLLASDLFTGPQILYQVPANVHQFYNWPINSAAIQAINPSTNLPTSGGPVQITGFPRNEPTPLVDRFSLDTEYDLGHEWVAKLGYQGSLSRHYTRTLNLNWFYPTALNPAVQSLTYYVNDGNGSYNAMLAELEHRFAHSFQIDVQYRWSHSIDDGSYDYFIGNYPYSLSTLKGNSDFDVRHNVKIYGVWSPSFGNRNGWMNKILGGWQISGILTWHTGFPWTPLYSNTSCNVAYPNSGYCNLTPEAYLGGAGHDTSNAAFMSGPNPADPTAVNVNFPKGALSYFTVPTFQYAANGCTPANQGSFPNYNPLCVGIPPAPSVGRNVLPGPGYFDTDATIQKSFGLPKLPILGENARFEFRADFFNVFNKLNLTPFMTGSPGQYTTSPGNVISNDGVTSNVSFGQARSALNGRIIELQARFSF